MNYRNSMHAHMMWSADLWDRINGGEQIDPDEIGRDDRCEIGRWLHGEGQTYKWLSDFGRLKELHAQFHQRAKQAVLDAESGNKEIGLCKLDAGGDCALISEELLQVSFEVFDVIERLEKG
jgi:hypothetical protein